MTEIKRTVGALPQPPARNLRFLDFPVRFAPVLIDFIKQCTSYAYAYLNRREAKKGV